MRKVVLVTTAVLAIAALAVSPAAAEGISPGGGSAFGQHVAGMAPEHAREHGQLFGQCVSTMAQTGVCPDQP